MGTGGIQPGGNLYREQAGPVYVELEAGGKEAFSDLIKEGVYSPYRWLVRHFREGEPNETLIGFTPEGEPYGFYEILSEEAPGTNIPIDSARGIALSFAREQWNIDLSPYELVEESEELQAGGRTDHTFVYERKDKQLGEARYRLRLMVSGDRFTELSHFIWIPEAFGRRYEEMRSANETIAFGASMSMVLLYILGGCVIGLFLLLRKKQVIWKTPFKWGIFVAFVFVLAQVNNLPLAWMDYDTALSSHGFILKQVAYYILIFLGLAALQSFTYMAAEGLTRNAFPNHIQLWKLWSRDAAASPSVLGRTAGGYLLTAVQLAFIIGFYFLMTRISDWWNPSDTLYSPDILATYMPWLSSIAISLHAGFWEECMFRAVPIAGAALIGNRFGHRKAWIAFALILQAVIFGAGHASYPAQPSYARVVELIIPSFIFGGIYIYFGLLPAIITHFTLDAVLIGLPLLVAESPGIWLDKTILIVLILSPLLVVLYRRRKAGAWREVPEELYNESWKPPYDFETDEIKEEGPAVFELSGATLRRITVLGAAGLSLWLVFGRFSQDAPPLHTKRAEAVAAAEKVLRERGYEPGEGWRAVSSVYAGIGDDDRFVWQAGGKAGYDSLMVKNIDPPHWLVRHVRFEGPVEERAEEFRVRVGDNTAVLGAGHRLPEGRPGDSLTVESARAIADSVISAEFGVRPEKLKVVSVEPFQLPKRRDWIFTYSDTAAFPLPEGEDRIRVRISGSEICQSWRSVHIPESWRRQDRDRSNTVQVVSVLSLVLLYGFVIAGVIYALVQWSRKRFNTRAFKIFFPGLAGVQLVLFFNRWPEVVAGFSTSMPFSNQVVMAVTSGIVSALLIAAAAGVLTGFLHDRITGERTRGAAGTLLAGAGAGTLSAGVLAAAGGLLPQARPARVSFESLSSSIPILGDTGSTVLQYVMYTVLFMLIFTAVRRFFRGMADAKTAVRRFIPDTRFFAGRFNRAVYPFSMGRFGFGRRRRDAGALPCGIQIQHIRRSVCDGGGSDTRINPGGRHKRLPGRIRGLCAVHYRNSDYRFFLVRAAE